MANWNDPQPSGWSPAGLGASAGLAGRGAVYDAGLRRYMLSIYNYMASGILLSGVVALLFATSGMADAVFGTPLRWLVALAPLSDGDEVVFNYRCAPLGKCAAGTRACMGALHAPRQPLQPAPPQRAPQAEPWPGSALMVCAPR